MAKRQLNIATDAEAFLYPDTIEFLQGIGWLRGVVLEVEAEDDWQLREIAEEIETELGSRGFFTNVTRIARIATTTEV